MLSLKWLPTFPIMSRLSLNAVLYSYRNVLSVALFLTALYFVLYTWVTIPPLALFLGWHPDTKLVVLETIIEEYQQYLEPDDTVLAIDGRPIRRGQLVFAAPVQPSYEFTLQRGERIFTQEIPVSQSQFFQMWALSLSILALAFWFIGFMTVRFARPRQSSPLYVGLGFQLIGAGIISPGPAQLGAPGAWVVGNVFVFFFPLIMLYLGYVPRHTPLNRATLRLFQGSFCLLTCLAIVTSVEVMFLFPDRSFIDIIGIRSATILTILTGVSVAAAITILFIRLIRSPKQSYERQQLSILFVFLFLAVAPYSFSSFCQWANSSLCPSPLFTACSCLPPLAISSFCIVKATWNWTPCLAG